MHDIYQSSNNNLLPSTPSCLLLLILVDVNSKAREWRGKEKEDNHSFSPKAGGQPVANPAREKIHVNAKSSSEFWSFFRGRHFKILNGD